MKILFTYIAILLTTYCSAQKHTTWDDIKIQRTGKKVIFTTKKMKLLKGDYVIASDNGSYSELTLKKGKVDGIRKDFDKNGKLIASRSFTSGKPNGIWRYYDSYGLLNRIENYVDGLKSGRWWTKTKKRNSFYTSESFYSDDIPVGHWIEKWEDSILIKEKTFTANGSYLEDEYYINGKLKSKNIYNNFKLDGEQLAYAKTGVLLSKLTYRNDLLLKKETFYKNGRPEDYFTYKNGRPHGKWTSYKRSGALSFEEEYENGYKSGVFKKYMGTEGWLYFITNYKDDTAHGPHEMYYRNKKLEQQGNYVNGSKDGLWKYYHIDGKLKREITYDMGVEVSRKEYSN